MNTCLVKDCNTKRRYTDYCIKHWRAWKKYGDPLGRHPLAKGRFKECIVENCDKKPVGNGYCRNHYYQLKRRGTTELLHRPTPEERYHSGYIKKGENECWNWIKSFNLNGYGKFHMSINGKKKSLVASRYGWELINGNIPDGLLVCHSCDNPPCQNPKHWFLGTSKDNTQDMIKKNRLHDQRGELNGVAKVTAIQVIEIRKRYPLDGISQAKLGKEYGLTQSGIKAILHRDTWKHI